VLQISFCTLQPIVAHAFDLYHKPNIETRAFCGELLYGSFKHVYKHAFELAIYVLELVFFATLGRGLVKSLGCQTRKDTSSVIDG